MAFLTLTTQRSIIALLLLLALAEVQAAPIDLASLGAQGDLVHLSVKTTGNSSLVISEDHAFTRADLGKVVEIFGGGVSTSASNHQDLIGKITDVVNEHAVRISPSPQITDSNIACVLGTDNAPIFQKAVEQASGSNSVIWIPAGNYLLIPRDLTNPNYQMQRDSETRAATTITKGGITFKGEDPKTTILTACGAWQLKGNYVSRGQIFECRGPVSHPEFPLVFENLTMDGGVQQGRLDYRGFPASTNDGMGWDITHDAVLDAGPQPLHSMKVFRNCIFQHWRGEILKGVSGAMNGFIEVTGCSFYDGNASAFNFDVSHHINHCTFSHLDMAMEFYEGRMNQPSLFENSSVSDVRADLVIVGALTNHPSPLYTIRNNYLQASNGFGIFLNPAKNVLIESNRFEGQSFCIGNGAGAQGTDYSHDIVIRGNTATNGGNLFLVQCGYSQRFENILVTGNIISGRGGLGCGWGYSTNVTFSNNIATNGALGFGGSRLTGQWFLDDPSNHYPPTHIDNWQGITNIMTYANGVRQGAYPTKSNSVFLIDDASPEKIPSGAMMTISNQGNHPTPLYLSSTHPAQSHDDILMPSNTITCTWTNGEWVLMGAARK
jgi:Right handed beta helix region